MASRPAPEAPLLNKEGVGGGSGSARLRYSLPNSSFIIQRSSFLHRGVGGGTGNLTSNATTAVPPGFPYPGAGFSRIRKMGCRRRPPSGCREGISVPFRPDSGLPPLFIIHHSAFIISASGGGWGGFRAHPAFIAHRSPFPHGVRQSPLRHSSFIIQRSSFLHRGGWRRYRKPDIQRHHRRPARISLSGRRLLRKPDSVRRGGPKPALSRPRE